MTAPRIDTTRKVIHHTIHELAEALEHLDDLHALAYDRHRAAAQARASGGDPTATGIDLDTNGDRNARRAYEQLADTCLRASDTIGIAITNAMATFDFGQIRARRDTTADATTNEVIDAIARGVKRHANGEAGSVATVTQPMPRNATRALDSTRLQSELDALRSAVRKAGQHPSRSRLTPLELNAWHTATGTTTKRKKGR